MTVVLNSVSTGDAVPLATPFKISAIATHDTATLNFTVSGTGPMQSYRLKAGGTARTNGTDLGHIGAVCGMDVCGASTRPVAASTPITFTPTITKAQMGAVADGAYTVNLYVRRNDTWE
jgi:hypothetical protein